MNKGKGSTLAMGVGKSTVYMVMFLAQKHKTTSGPIVPL